MTAGRSAYRRTFIGREPQLRQLEAAFAAASAGRGCLALIVGESGIGKTALCEQLAAHVAAQGGRTLVGRCYEPGSGGSLPYLPFVEALRGYILTQPVEGLRAELGSNATEVARLVPEIRERLGVEPPPPGGDPEAQRWRLLQATSDAIASIGMAASPGGLLLLLEDLHWADRGTLDLLGHLGRALTTSRALLVGTYRDLEVDRTHPLSATLAELRRHGEISRIQLQGLTQDEVGRLLTAYAHMGLSPALAEALHHQTEGNPLFIQEIVRYLLEGNQPLDRGDIKRPVRERSAESPIPSSLRDVIGKRLSHLSPDSARLLALAAVVGPEFRLETLQHVAAVDEDALIASLEEATRVGILEEIGLVGPVQYQFAHALFHQCLYEELSAPRRVRAHQAVARVLERQYADRLTEHAAELAEHFARSGQAGDLAKAVHYAELAAQQAMTVFAHAEAVRLLERALAVQQAHDPKDVALRCDLLLALSEALDAAGQPKLVYEEVADEAFQLADQQQDRERAGRACSMALRALQRFGAPATWGTPTHRRWLERADRYAAPGRREQVIANVAAHAILIGPECHWGEGRLLHLQTLELARQLGEANLYFSAVTMATRPYWSPDHWGAQLELAHEVATLSSDGVSTQTLQTVLRRLHQIFMIAGDREASEKASAGLKALEHTRDPAVVLWPFQAGAISATMAGNLEQALAFGRQLQECAEGQGTAVRSEEISRELVGRPLAYLGRTDGAAAVLAAFARYRTIHRGPEGDLLGAWLARELAHAGEASEAAELAARVLLGMRVEPRWSDAPATILGALLEVAVLTEDRETLSLVTPRLDGLTAVNGLHVVHPVARFRGSGARLLGERRTALLAYQQALQWATRLHHRPEIALTRLGIAELLLDESLARGVSREERVSNRAEALAHLEFAIGELRAMQMAPGLKRALALQQAAAVTELPLAHRPRLPGDLTERELEILRLVAAGKSSRLISEELVLSVRTVDRHIINIYSKLDMRTRAQATAYAHTHGLLSAE
jgi:DNA-binding CsgD family transcriptional regulator